MAVSTSAWLPPPEKDFAAARRQYVELYGSLAVMNTYLKIALVSVVGVCLGLIGLTAWMGNALLHVKPMVIRITDVGRAEAVTGPDLEYHPQEPEIKYFLIDFIERHYSRMRATVRDNYARSLYFLDGRLADALIEANKKTNAIEAFLAGAGEEIEIRVTSVSIEDLRKPPYRAVVDFEKVYLAQDRTVTKREKYVANVVFVIKDQVPNAMVPINPLGLTITYFRDDQTFQ